MAKTSVTRSTRRTGKAATPSLKKPIPPFDGKTPKERRQAARFILDQMHQVGMQLDAVREGRQCHASRPTSYGGWAYMLAGQPRGLMRLAYDAHNLVASTADLHPRAKERARASEDAEKELAAVAEQVWAMPVRHEQDLVNRALICDYHTDRNLDGSVADMVNSASPPDVANAHLMVAVLVRNGHQPGDWGPCRGKRSIAAARGQPSFRLSSAA
jgi:hypothetical protein